MTAPNPLAAIPAVYIDVYQTNPTLSATITRNRAQRWRWRASSAGNNRTLAMSSEAYTNREDAIAAVNLLFGQRTDIYLRDPTNPTTKIRSADI